MAGSKVPKKAMPQNRRLTATPRRIQAPPTRAPVQQHAIAVRQNMMDPAHPHSIPVTHTDGQAFPYTGLVRLNVNHTLGSLKIVVITNTGDSGTLLTYINNTSTPFLSTSTVPALANGGTSGGPTSSRSMKFSAEIINTTKILDMGGRVYALNVDQRVVLPNALSSMTQAQFKTFADTVIAHPECQALSGTYFEKPKCIVGTCVNNPEYERFKPFVGIKTADGVADSWALWDSPLVPLVRGTRSMSTVILVFDEFSTAQSYTVSAHGSWYTRWPLESILGQSMSDIPTADASFLNNLSKHASTFGKTMSELRTYMNAAHSVKQALGDIRRGGKPYHSTAFGSVR
jgi:hypothetical protein